MDVAVYITQPIRRVRREVTLLNFDTRRLAAITAAVSTTAAFSKTFVPFYLIGSTTIFAAACTCGAALVAVSWRPIYEMASRVTIILLVLTAFYGLVIANFLFHSRLTVPATHLIGILIFHASFLIFGFSAARAPKIVSMMLLGAAAVYSLVIINYTARFGDLMQESHLQDIFGVGDKEVFETFYQNIGIVLALAALAGMGLSSNRVSKFFALGALPFVLLFLFHISARGALVALACSLFFLAVASLSARARMLTLVAATAVITMILTSALFYQRTIPSKDLGLDAISRTIREIQNPPPGLRVAIWTQTWQRISSEPDRLLFGRGIGMYPVIEGFGAPDWLLRKSEGSRHYPHNVYLEMLYETGIVGLLLFGLLTLFPLGIALRRWHLFSLVQKSAISMYVFQLVSSQVSGAFAYGYLDQFFFGLTVGIIALNRAGDVLVPGQRITQGTE